MPAIKNGIDTWSVVFHHSSILIGIPFLDSFRSKPFPAPSSPPFGSSEDAIDVVVIELNEPCDEADNVGNLPFSLSKENDLGEEK